MARVDAFQPDRFVICRIVPACRDSSRASTPRDWLPVPGHAAATPSDSRTRWRRTTGRCGSGSYTDRRPVHTILIDCALRPEECFRLRPSNLVEETIEIMYGKTENARRRIPMTARVRAILDLRLEKSRNSSWIFPAATKSGHIEIHFAETACERASRGYPFAAGTDSEQELTVRKL